jgi:hypothetical protein
LSSVALFLSRICYFVSWEELCHCKQTLPACSALLHHTQNVSYFPWEGGLIKYVPKMCHTAHEKMGWKSTMLWCFRWKVKKKCKCYSAAQYLAYLFKQLIVIHCSALFLTRMCYFLSSVVTSYITVYSYRDPCPWHCVRRLWLMCPIY